MSTNPNHDVTSEAKQKHLDSFHYKNSAITKDNNCTPLLFVRLRPGIKMSCYEKNFTTIIHGVDEFDLVFSDCAVPALRGNKYSQTSVFERLAVQTIRFSNGKLEMKITRSSNKNSVLKQFKRKIYLNQRDRE